MPGSLTQKSQGALRDGWTADVQDYALVCDWAAGGGVLLVGDASSTLSCLDGKSGELLWKQADVHEGGLLTLAVHPNGKILASSGQDGKVVFGASLTVKTCVTRVSKSWVSIYLGLQKILAGRSLFKNRASTGSTRKREMAI